MVWLRVQGRARRRRSQRRRTKGPKDGAGQRAPRYDWRGNGAREEGLGECDLPLWRGRGEREEGERMVSCGSSSSALLRLPRNGQQGHGAAGFGPGRRGRGRIGSRGLVDEVVVMRLCFLRYPVASASASTNLATKKGVEGACGLPLAAAGPWGAVWGGASLTAPVTASLREPLSLTQRPPVDSAAGTPHGQESTCAHSASQCMRLRPPTLKSPCLSQPQQTDSAVGSFAHQRPVTYRAQQLPLRSTLCEDVSAQHHVPLPEYSSGTRRPQTFNVRETTWNLSPQVSGQRG